MLFAYTLSHGLLREPRLRLFVVGIRLLLMVPLMVTFPLPPWGERVILPVEVPPRVRPWKLVVWRLPFAVRNVAFPFKPLLTDAVGVLVPDILRTENSADAVLVPPKRKSRVVLTGKRAPLFMFHQLLPPPTVQLPHDGVPVPPERRQEPTVAEAVRICNWDALDQTMPPLFAARLAPVPPLLKESMPEISAEPVLKLTVPEERRPAVLWTMPVPRPGMSVDPLMVTVPLPPKGARVIVPVDAPPMVKP